MLSRFPSATMMAIAMLAAFSVAQAQPITQPRTPPPGARMMSIELVDSLEAWDMQVSQLTRMAWGVNAASASMGVDRAGRTMESYWNENVLTPEAKRQLDELHAKAAAQSASGDSDGLKRTIAEAAPILQAQAYRSFIVMGYWVAQESLTYQEKLLQPWLDRAPREERKSVSDRVNTAVEALKKNYADALQAQKISMSFGPAADLPVTINSALQSLNDERISLVKQQADLPSPFQTPSLTRAQPCTISNAPKPGKNKPSIAPGFPSSESFYPPEMKRHGATGVVVVNVDVSPMGCADAASVVTSSGVKDLDEAALRLAIAGVYIPAADGDKPVPGTLKFRIGFTLYDTPKPPP